MRGTKIIVLRMKELIYTAIFAGVGIILLLLIVYLFVGKGRSEGKQDTADANERYQAGIYTKDITLGESTASLEVALDTDHIKSVKIVPLDESITTMYPINGAGSEKCIQPARSGSCARRGGADERVQVHATDHC